MVSTNHELNQFLQQYTWLDGMKSIALVRIQLDLMKNQWIFLLFAWKQVLNSLFLLNGFFLKRGHFYLAGQITFLSLSLFLPQGWLGCLGCLSMVWAAFGFWCSRWKLIGPRRIALRTNGRQPNLRRNDRLTNRPYFRRTMIKRRERCTTRYERCTNGVTLKRTMNERC